MSQLQSYKCPMSLCCELPKIMHSRDKVPLTGIHDRQELDTALQTVGSLGHTGMKRISSRTMQRLPGPQWDKQIF